VSKEMLTRLGEFQKELQTLINSYSIDNYCQTPDFLLSSYLVENLRGIRRLVVSREQWHGRSVQPQLLEDPKQKDRADGK
jgi:hypothetical protein